MKKSLLAFLTTGLISVLSAQPALKPIVTLKLAPAQETLAKIAETAAAIYPSPQVASAPMMLGLMLGDPSMETVSKDADVALIYFNALEAKVPAFAVLLKLTEDSPVKTTLATQYNMTLTPAGDWTIATLDPTLLDRVSSVEDLVTIAEAKRAYDIELSVMAKDLWVIPPQMLQGIVFMQMSQQAGTLSQEDQSALMSGISIAFDIAQSIERLDMGLDLSAKEIGFAKAVTATPESPLHALFSAPKATTTVDMAKYLPASGFTYGWMNLPTTSFLTFLGTYVNKFSEEAPGKWSGYATTFQTYLDDVSRAFGGNMAFFADLDGMNNVGVSIAETSFTRDEFSAFSEKYTHLLFDDIYSDPLVEQAMSAKVSGGYKRNITEIAGVPVDALEFTIDYTEAFLPDVTSAYYYAVTDGTFVQASSEELMATTLNAVTSDSTVSGNVASAVPPSDAAFRVAVDLGKYMSAILSAVEAASPEGQSPLGTVALKPFSTEAVMFEGTMTDGTLSVSGSIPNSAIATVVEKVSAAMPGEDGAGTEAPPQ